MHKHRTTSSKFKSLSLRGDLDDWWYILGTRFWNLPNEEKMLYGVDFGWLLPR